MAEPHTHTHTQYRQSSPWVEAMAPLRINCQSLILYPIEQLTFSLQCTTFCSDAINTPSCHKIASFCSRGARTDMRLLEKSPANTSCAAWADVNAEWKVKRNQTVLRTGESGTSATIGNTQKPHYTPGIVQKNTRGCFHMKYLPPWRAADTHGLAPFIPQCKGYFLWATHSF